jgi:carbonic anhydrase
MQFARPLPEPLVERHRVWRAGLSAEERSLRAKVALEGQDPEGMIIACCDSRVMTGAVFGGTAGDFFVHRNIANLVPRCVSDDAYHGTSATIEFAVGVLKVRRLIVMGHLGCGGVAGCLQQHAEAKAGGGTGGGFVARWLTILEPRVPKVLALGLDAEGTQRALEHEGVLLSLENLMTFPFVAERVHSGKLELHGIWKDIGNGVLEVFDPERGGFREVADQA